MMPTAPGVVGPVTILALGSCAERRFESCRGATFDQVRRSAGSSCSEESWIQSHYSASMPGRPRRSRGHIETLPCGSFRAKVYAGIDPLTRERRYRVETVASENSAKIA